MNMLIPLTMIVIGTLFLSALVTPPVYSLLSELFGEFPWPYSRVYDRVAMVVAAGLLVYYRKQFELGALIARVREEWSPTFIKRLLAAALISSLSALVMLPFFVDGIDVSWKMESTSYYAGKLGKALLAAFLVGLIEELFFRVVLLAFFLRKYGFWIAATFSSAIYAIVHFIKPDKSWEYPGLGLFVGIDYLWAVALKLFESDIFMAVAGLYLVGMVLCLVIHKTSSLALVIGLHAGWIIAVKMASAMTQLSASFSEQIGVGSRFFLVSRPLSWITVLFVGVAVTKIFRPKLSESLEEDDGNSVAKVEASN